MAVSFYYYIAVLSFKNKEKQREKKDNKKVVHVRLKLAGEKDCFISWTFDISLTEFFLSFYLLIQKTQNQ